MREPTTEELVDELYRDPDFSGRLTEKGILAIIERDRAKLTERWKALNFPRVANDEIPYSRNTTEGTSNNYFEQEQAAIERNLRRGGYKTWDELKEEYRRTGLTERERDEAEKHKHDHWGVLRDRD